jgi:hypothetical protein
MQHCAGTGAGIRAVLLSSAALVQRLTGIHRFGADQFCI